MDRRYIVEDNYILDYDLQLDIKHGFRKFQDTDLCIFDWHKLDLMDILHLWHIQVYKLVVHRHNQPSKYKLLGYLQIYIYCLVRKVMVCTGPLFPVLLNEIIIREHKKT